MSTTNDDQAKYGTKEEPRAPMLSDEEWPFDSPKTPERMIGVMLATRYYESLIISGVLRVVKKVEYRLSDPRYLVRLPECSSCGYTDFSEDNDEYLRWTYCPGCGAQIVK